MVGGPRVTHSLTRMCRSWKKMSSVCRISWNSPAERPPYVCQRQSRKKHFTFRSELRSADAPRWAPDKQGGGSAVGADGQQESQLRPLTRGTNFIMPHPRRATPCLSHSPRFSRTSTIKSISEKLGEMAMFCITAFPVLKATVTRHR